MHADRVAQDGSAAEGLRESSDLQECQCCSGKSYVLYGDDLTARYGFEMVCAWCLRHLGRRALIDELEWVDLDPITDAKVKPCPHDIYLWEMCETCARILIMETVMGRPIAMPEQKGRHLGRQTTPVRAHSYDQFFANKPDPAYWLTEAGRLWLRLPGGYQGSIGEDEGWTFTENEDGTLTVSPSIWANAPRGWHGYLREGIFIEA